MRTEGLNSQTWGSDQRRVLCSRSELTTSCRSPVSSTEMMNRYVACACASSSISETTNTERGYRTGL